MEFDIAVLSGDGVGPEVITQALKILQTVGEKFGHSFHLHDGLIGGVAIDALGTALNDETLMMCKQCNAVLLGAVGGSKWDDPQAKIHPEDGLLALRKGLRLFANLRPVKVFPMLVNYTNLKPEVVRGVDLVVVRELTGGIYFGQPKKQWRTPKGRQAVDTLAYSEMEIERILKVGFELARSRRKKLTSVDKANVLQSSRLWRQIAIEISADYPDIELQHMLVDACAMRFIQRPADLDVLTFGMYEPIHGSAPSRAGQNLANPIATILSVAMMLRYSFALEIEAQTIENAVLAALEQDYRTYDIMSEGKTKVGTKEMGDLIAQKVKG